MPCRTKFSKSLILNTIAIKSLKDRALNFRLYKNEKLNPSLTRNVYTFFNFVITKMLIPSR